MVNETSSIIDFYPKDFESDLNGKQQTWEAVVLIPFIDEKRLLEAMEPYVKKLTPDEIRREFLLVCLDIWKVNSSDQQPSHITRSI